jgi:hypothetical protein
MMRMRTWLVGALAGSALVGAGVGLARMGLQIRPEAFPAYPEATPTFETIPLPEDLPAPVARFYRSVYGNEVPLIHSAVITAEGDLRFGGVTFPARLRFTHEAGKNYRHYIEATMWGAPVLQVNESYLDQQARLELPFGVIEHDPKVNAAANLGLWGESIWLASLFVTDPRVRWEAVDDISARLIVPFGNEEDRFMVRFDRRTDLIETMSALRWKGNGSNAQRVGWHLNAQDWAIRHGILLPLRGSVTWTDEESPWLDLNLSDIAFNVDVSRYIRERGI